jgi:hypothetical protein
MEGSGGDWRGRVIERSVVPRSGTSAKRSACGVVCAVAATLLRSASLLSVRLWGVSEKETELCIARRVSTLRGGVPGESRQVRVRCERGERAEAKRATGCKAEKRNLRKKQRAKTAAKRR